MPLLNKAKLVSYVLHAKHSKIESKLDNLEKVIGADFSDIV